MFADSPTRKCRVEFNQGGKTCIRGMFKLIYADSRFNWGDWPTILGGKAEQKHIARSCHDLGFDSGSR